MIRLGVNLDHVATVRQARGETYPDPVQAAVLAELGGADNITAHLREDRRHIQDRDVFLLKETIKIPLNFEMAASREMIEIALKLKPHAVTLVPEKREERTTEGGLNLKDNFEQLKMAVDKLQTAGVLVALFIEPDTNAVEMSKKINAKAVEFHTGHWAIKMRTAVSTLEKSQLTEKLRIASEAARQVGIQAHFGHGITYDNAPWLQTVPWAEEANIGHVIVGRAIFVGLQNAVGEMKIALTDKSLRPLIPNFPVKS